MNPRVEELGDSSPSSTSSPLRRRSSVAHQTVATSLVTENDDEAERRVRRHEQNVPQGGQAGGGRRSLGLSLVAQLSHLQVAEKLQQCIQLNAENKINAKNAFTLQMIDFMTYMIKKQDANMNNLQLASTSLDVSTKIYGLRVDGIHTDIMKISGGLDKRDRNNENGAESETAGSGGEAEGDEGAEAERRARAAASRKKRQSKRKILASPESLAGPTETVNFASTIMDTGDSQTSDTLYLATLPHRADRGLYLSLSDDAVLDEANPAEEEEANRARIPLPMFLGDHEHLEICSSFAHFEILGWSVDDETETLPCSQDTPMDVTAPISGNFRFDLDASLAAEAGGEPSSAGMNFFDIEEEEEEEGNVVGYERLGGQPGAVAANIVDFREVLVAPSVREQNFEYSYLESNVRIQWAGPSYWKIRHPSKNLAGSRIIGRCDQEPIKRKKELIVAFNEEAAAAAGLAFEPVEGDLVTIQAKTARSGWPEDKITLPQDMHYTVAEICKYYLAEKLLQMLQHRGTANAATDVSDEIDDYNYNNEHDTTDYCPNIDSEEQGGATEGVLGNGEDGADGAAAAAADENAAVCTQAFTGDNLVQLPKITSEIVLASLQRSKRIDMRQLKKCMWKKLTSIGVVEEEKDQLGERQDAENRERVHGTVAFSQIYEALPKMLSRSSAEALSVPVAFSSLLHLANEKTLRIESPDGSDLYIRQE